MLVLEEAVKCLLCHTNAITETELIPLLTSTNRILAAPLLAMVDQPPFPRSPLDGYAVREIGRASCRKRVLRLV